MNKYMTLIDVPSTDFPHGGSSRLQQSREIGPVTPEQEQRKNRDDN
jgi:hypothetical protein